MSAATTATATTATTATTTRRGARSCFGVVLALAVLGPANDAAACATVVQQGEPPVELKREEALIVWNEATKEEHFIRRAVFDTRAKSFAFLVPTPTRPFLSEASAALFDELKLVTKPEIREEKKWRVVTASEFACGSCFMMRKSVAVPAGAPETAAAAPAVQVLEETRVAGMDATVLASTDTDALAKWLGEHGFPFRPELREWLAPYVDRGFTITAFQYARPDVAANGALGLAIPVAPTAVRLSFKSERAFYPYREPSDAPAVASRQLHLFVLSTGRAEAAVGGTPASLGAPWSSAGLEYSKPLLASSALARSLVGVTAPEGVWLTEFVDYARSRVRDDVFFAKSKSTEPVTPPPIIRIVGERFVFLPLDLMALVAGALLLWRRRRVRLAREREKPVVREP